MVKVMIYGKYASMHACKVKCKVQIVSMALQFPVHYHARPDSQDSNYHIVIFMRSRDLGFWSDELMV